MPNNTYLLIFTLNLGKTIMHLWGPGLWAELDNVVFISTDILEHRQLQTKGVCIKG